MRQFKDINEMARRYNSSKNSQNMELYSLNDFQFICLIYTLDTGQFEITGFTDVGYLRYFLTSGETEKENWALDIANNLPYTKEDFIAVI